MAFFFLYNITISSHSPTFQYSPARNGPIYQGWNASYSGRPDVSWPINAQDIGFTTHRTTLPGASAELTWTGTAVSAYGTANGAYSFLVDGRVPESNGAYPRDGILGRVIGLPYGEHTMIIRTETNLPFSLSGVVLTVGLGAEL